MKALQNLFRPFNILAWPTWLKLSSGFLFAILLPILLILLVAQNGFATISRENLRTYIEEFGEQKRAAISDALSTADDTIEGFLRSTAYQEQMTEVLRQERPSLLTMRLLGENFQNILLGSDEYEKIRLINLDGNVVAQATTTSLLFSVLNDPESPTYQQAATAAIGGREHIIAVFGSNPVSIEVSHAIFDAANLPLGFLVGTLDIEKTIYATLSQGGNTYPVYSYLAYSGQNPILLAPEDNLDQARLSLPNSTAVQQALAGESGIDNYAIGETQSTDVIGYYAPIYGSDDSGNALFALVTEAHADIPLQQATGYFNGSRAFPIALGLIAVLVVLVLLFQQILVPPLANLKQAIQAVTRGNFDTPVNAAGRGDEIGEVGAAFVDMRVQVRSLVEDLQARVAARTRDIAATQEISRYAATQHNLQTLLDQVVQLIVEQFPNIYHAQIFLIDQERAFAMLRASTGEPGRLLLARGHKLAIGSVSVIGQVIEQQQIIIARDTASSQIHRRNEFLPDTRAELAIPLRVAGEVIGALDVQSKYRNAFTEDEVSVLQTMADQIAVAIENARLYQESVRRLDDIERANRIATRNTWQEYVYGQRARLLSSEAGKASSVDLSEIRQQAIAQGRIIAGQITSNNTVPVAVPIELRGQILGAVEWELPADDLNENRLQLAQELANRLAVSLENARLFEESQRATERERIVNAIAARLTPQTEISEILQTAVREVGQALRAPQVSIRLYQPGKGGSNGNNGSNGDHE